MKYSSGSMKLGGRDCAAVIRSMAMTMSLSWSFIELACETQSSHVTLFGPLLHWLGDDHSGGAPA
jgi:hypothetical protein